MKENPTLGLENFEEALAILKREQQANMPSRKEELYFRYFNLVVYAFFGLCVLLVSLEPTKKGIYQNIWLWGWGLAGVLSLAILPLFFLNLGFMKKLRRQAKLRRRLNLDTYFKPLFRAQRRESTFSNFWTLLVSFTGYGFVLLGLILLIFSIALIFSKGGVKEIGLLFPVSFVGLVGFALAVVGLSSIFLHFMRRGEARLKVVNDLQTSLSKHEKSFEEDSQQRISIDADEYDLIARIERAQIIADRQRSIDKGVKEARTAGYLIQQSRDVIDSKSRLDPAIRPLVEDQILQLTTDPAPIGSREEPGSGLIRLLVPETPVEIVYQVDRDNHRLRVFSLGTRASGG